jgi:phage shock protein E
MARIPVYPRKPRGLVALALVAVLVAGTAACSGTGDDQSTSTGTAATTGTTTAAVRHSDPAAFAALVAQPGTVLLDVRTPAEYAAGHLPEARNLDMNSSGFTQQLSILDKSASYALYCRSGTRSNIAAQQMLAVGFTNVVDLTGGITAWTAAGRAVVGS